MKGKGATKGKNATTNAKAAGKDSPTVKRKTGTAIDPLDVETDESDGESALRVLEAQEQSHPEKKARARLMVVRDVRMRWNYTHAMIRRALLLKEVSMPWPYMSVSSQVSA